MVYLGFMQQIEMLPSGERLKMVGGLETILFVIGVSVCFQEPNVFGLQI